MTALIVTVEVRPEAVASFEKSARLVIEAIHAHEPGCRLYRLIRSRDNPHSYVLLEIYADQNALDAHRNSAHFAVFRDALKDKLAGPPATSVFDVVD